MDNNCKKYQSMIESFLSDSLTGIECKDFISHVKNCNECMDELQVNYVISSVLSELDEDTGKTKNSKKGIKNEDSDYIAGLKKKLDTAMDIYSFKIKDFFLPIVLSLAALLLIVLAIIFR